MSRLLYILFFIFPILGYSQTDTIVHLYSFGGLSNDKAEEVQATSDGGYIVIGSTSSNSSGNTDAYLLKVDSLCNYEWSFALGGTNNDWGYSIKQTLDKGYIIAASSNSYGTGGYDAVLMKRDSLGNYEWRKTYGGVDWDFAYSVTQTYDSGYVFCGETYNNTNGFSDVYVVRTSPIGDTLWTKSFGGALIDKGNSIIETSDSNIVIGGITNTITDSSQFYVIKLAANGNLIWDSIYGDTLYENLNQIIETNNGDYVFTGTTNSLSINGDLDYLIKRITNNGSFIWDFTIQNGPVPTPDDEEALTIFELPNNTLLVSGYSKTGGGVKDVIFIVLNSGGGWMNSAVIGNSADDYVSSITIGNNGNWLGAGSTNSFGSGMEDVLLVRLDTLYASQDTVTYIYSDFIPLMNNTFFNQKTSLQIYPNPVHNYFYIQLNNQKIEMINLFDLLGKKVLSTNNYNFGIDISHLNKGVYLIEITTDSQKHYQGKIIKN